MSDDARRALFALVPSIPSGRVMTYGQLADVLAERDEATLTARQVGRMMGQAPEGVPWHRVVNASGRSSIDSPSSRRQETRLQEEGVEMNDHRLSLRRYRYEP